MTRHWHPTLEHIVRWRKPSAESFAAAAAVYSPELMLQLEATKGAVEGSLSPGPDGRAGVSTSLARSATGASPSSIAAVDEPDNDTLSMRDGDDRRRLNGRDH